MTSTARPSEPTSDAQLAHNGDAVLLRVALAQISPVLGDRERNVALHLEQIEAARQQRADLIVFPELSLTGYFLRDMVPDMALTPAGPEVRRLVEAAGAPNEVQARLRRRLEAYRAGQPTRDPSDGGA